MSHFHRQLNWTTACAPFKHVNKPYCNNRMYTTYLSFLFAINLHNALNSFYSSIAKSWDFTFTVMLISPVSTKGLCCLLCILPRECWGWEYCSRDMDTCLKLQSDSVKSCRGEVAILWDKLLCMLLPILCLITQCQGVNYIWQCSGREQLNCHLAVAPWEWQLYFYTRDGGCSLHSLNAFTEAS